MNGKLIILASEPSINQSACVNQPTNWYFNTGPAWCFIIAELVFGYTMMSELSHWSVLLYHWQFYGDWIETKHFWQQGLKVIQFPRVTCFLCSMLQNGWQIGTFVSDVLDLNPSHYQSISAVICPQYNKVIAYWLLEYQ